MEDAVLYLVGIVAALAVLYLVLYGLLWALPYLIFYLLPGVIVSFLVGFALRYIARRKGKSLDYRRVVLTQSILVTITYLLVKFPEAHQVIVKGKSSQIVLQWPWVYEIFNQFNSGWRQFFSLILGHQSYAPVFFDRNDVSVITWVSVLVGAPALFWVFSGKDVEEEQRCARIKIESLVSAETRKWQNLEDQWKKEKSELQSRMSEYCQYYLREKEERKRLEVKLEYAPHTGKGLTTKLPQSEEVTPGVLDSDLF